MSEGTCTACQRTRPMPGANICAACTRAEANAYGIWMGYMRPEGEPDHRRTVRPAFVPLTEREWKRACRRRRVWRVVGNLAAWLLIAMLCLAFGAGWVEGLR